MSLEVRLLLVAEDALAARAAKALAEGSVRGTRCRWIAPRWGSGDQPELVLTYAIRDARRAGLKRYGKFGGASGLPDALQTRAILDLMKHHGQEDLVLVVARDLDDQPERRSGMRQALDEAGRDALLATPLPESEAWIVAGFEPEDDEERARLTAVKKNLGFDPTERPHELRHHGPKDSKPVLEALTGGDVDREDCCLANLERLRRVGEDYFLLDYLNQCAAHLGPADA
jgi:hypothetical protein